MGWTGMHRERGLTDREFWAKELSPNYTILDTHSKGGVFYAAVRYDGEQASKGRVFALVCLQQWSRGDYYNFHYKDMDETVGPCYYGCPDRILDLLTPTDSEWANEWRQKCREYNAAQAARPKVKKGDVVKFDQTLKFTDGVERDTFTFIERTTFRTEGGGRVKIPNWKSRAYTVVQAVAA